MHQRREKSSESLETSHYRPTQVIDGASVSQCLSPSAHIFDTSHSPALDDDDLYVTISSLRKVAPEGWTMYTHPRGSIYFRHSHFRIVVDEDIRIPAQLEKVTHFWVKDFRVDIPEDLEAYLAYGSEMAVCLFANHKQCVAGYELSKLLSSSSIRDLSVDAR